VDRTRQVSIQVPRNGKVTTNTPCMIIIPRTQYNSLLKFEEMLGRMSQLTLNAQFPCHRYFWALPNVLEYGGLGTLISLNYFPFVYCYIVYYNLINPSLHLAKHIVNLFPPLVTNTWMTPKYIMGINLPLDFQQARIVSTPESLLEVGFISVCLVTVSVV
jgi:hypothetical protein